jgi:hypothetical protein
MGLSPFSIGNGEPWPGQGFTTDSGIFPLTGVLDAAIALHMQDINNNNALYVCTGTWHITNVGSLGPPVVIPTATFTPSVADLTTGFLGKVGMYKAYPVVTLSTGPVPMDAQTIQVVSLP